MTSQAAVHEPQLTAPVMSPLTTRSLHDGIVVIGPVLPEDSAKLFLWLNDVESAHLDLPYRPLDWMGFNNWLGDLSKNPSQVFFAIRRIDNPAIIGFIALTKIQPIHRSAELGVRIGEKTERGKGYGGNAIALALQYAWNNLNLHRVHLTVFDTNFHAISAYMLAGFRREGLMQQAAFINGNWCNVVQMAALRP